MQNMSRPGVLRNVIVAGYVIFCHVNKFSVNILFFITDKMALRAVVWPAGRSLAGGP